MEDTDHLDGGVNVFNGQNSVLWNNVRDAFPAEITQMYQRLRSDGTLSYPTVKARFEGHQAKWPEAIFNEDAYFKYITPLTQPDPGKEPTAVYLPMAQGSKAEQRKWWLYNRFRYLDSKWNAGDALSDVIQLRGYAKSNIVVTPYADIYPAVKYGSYYVSERGWHGIPTTLVCPLSSVNDTEIIVYSASQIEDVGDLSGLKVGFADFSKATKLKAIKVGSGESGYYNPNLTELHVGTNALLKSVDARNCTTLGGTVDLGGASGLATALFDGTAVTSVSLPSGGTLRTLHLPATVANLTVRGQAGITDFSMPSYASVTTLRVESCGDAIPYRAILAQMAAGSRVRLTGFVMHVTSTQDVEGFYDLLDTMRGIDESGGNVDKAQVGGTITGLGTVDGAWMGRMMERYPTVTIGYEHINSVLTYKTYDGSSTLYTETIADGGDGTYAGSGPSRSSDIYYSYEWAGWSRTMDGDPDPDATKNVVGDRIVYAAYDKTPKLYTVKWANADGTVLRTDENVPYSDDPHYPGATPTYFGQTAKGWLTISNMSGVITYVADYLEDEEIADSWDDIIASVNDGTALTKYKVGNYKPINLGSYGTVNMQVAAKMADALADSDGTATLTFVAKEALSKNSVMGYSGYTPSNVGGWEATKLRNDFLGANGVGQVLAQSYPNVAAAIKPVSKTSLVYDGDNQAWSDQTTADRLWVPSIREAFGLMDSYRIVLRESSGPMYHGVFRDGSDRERTRPGGSSSYWWLRSTQIGAYSDREFSYSYNNDVFSARSDTLYYVVLGFCI